MKSAYLVLDMQNDLIHDDGASGKSPLNEQVRARGIIPRTADAIRKARALGHIVVFVRVAFSDDHREVNPNSPVFGPIKANGLLKASQWGSAVHGALGVAADDWNIIKQRVSPFYCTNLEAQLRLHGVQRVYCSGVTTQAVVQAAVREAHDRDFRVVLLEDCCAARAAQEHSNSVGSLGSFCTVTDSLAAFATAA